MKKILTVLSVIMMIAMVSSFFVEGLDRADLVICSIGLGFLILLIMMVDSFMIQHKSSAGYSRKVRGFLD
jgi:hypothetical protein